jgi:hypothetical protein
LALDSLICSCFTAVDVSATHRRYSDYMNRERRSFYCHGFPVRPIAMRWSLGLVFLCCHVGTLICCLGAESVAKLRSAVSEWVNVEKAISQEALAWKEKRELLEDLTSLSQNEIASLEREIKRASEDASDADHKRAKMLADGKALDESGERISVFLEKMEGRLDQWKPRFPQPLINDLGPVFVKLNGTTSQASSGSAERMQTVVMILDAVQKFDRKVTVFEEVRELGDGSSGIVKTLYFGLGAAYYVSEANDDAGIGRPSSSGWNWTPRPEIKKNVEAALRVIEQGGSRASFVSLPFSLKGSTEE